MHGNRRRHFLRAMTTGGGALVCAALTGTASAQESPPPAVRVVPLADLVAAETGVEFTYHGAPALLVTVPAPPDEANAPRHLLRLPGPSVVWLAAYERACTHLGCPVHLNAAERTLYCGCHGSQFFAWGEVKSGPADRPLDALTLEVRDGAVWAVGRR